MSALDDEIMERALHHAMVEIFGGAPAEEIEIEMRWGPATDLVRVFRDGTRTTEILPRFLAELALAGIPETEPMVARARLQPHVTTHKEYLETAIRAVLEEVGGS